jgi:predicted GNAT family acetyltransferase
MTHPLDRPAWHALRTRQMHLALGEGRALRYQSDYAIFAATGDDGAESVRALEALIRVHGPAILLGAGEVPDVPGTVVEKAAIGLQMVADAVAPPGQLPDVLELGDADAPEMLALATLTEPGPFFTRTQRLGRFIGVRREGRLIAMAGERMKLIGFTEVSGVCTHPDFRGQGLAGALMRIVSARIIASGEKPFLHAYADNKGAIALYETLGFRVRAEMAVRFLV